MGLDNPTHILFLFVLVLLVFGARRLPEIGRSLGTGLREFKQSISGDSHAHEPQQPTLPPVAPQAPVPPVDQAPPPAEQTAPPAQTVPEPQAEDAFAQREPAATDRR
jgi:sec-independent protein translocase protein TatA